MMMLSLIFPTNSVPLALSYRTHSRSAVFSESSHVLFSPSISLSDGVIAFRRQTRGCTVVTRSGPSTSNYLLAFAIPLSLIAVTVFTSIKIADKLDDDFLEEVVMNQAVKEAEAEEGEETEISLDDIVQEPVVERTRNRPKREA